VNWRVVLAYTFHRSRSDEAEETQTTKVIDLSLDRLRPKGFFLT
jgi:hypothetical protein